MKSMRWHNAGTMKLKLAHAREPIKAMKRPKPGTPAATRAMNSTKPMRTAAKTAVWDLELYLFLKASCDRPTESSGVVTAIASGSRVQSVSRNRGSTVCKLELFASD